MTLFEAEDEADTADEVKCFECNCDCDECDCEEKGGCGECGCRA